MVAIEWHFKLDENGEGKCSVPMWRMGMPAGFCNKTAYGKPVKNSHYTGYVPGLACPGHGGPKKPIEEVYDCPIHGTAHGGIGECPLC